uniref:Uncharacterized protein n=1 Tax=Anguilla anguilla TaxID=7936 RepID=A0A0E9TYC2_ANGAN
MISLYKMRDDYCMLCGNHLRVLFFLQLCCILSV